MWMCVLLSNSVRIGGRTGCRSAAAASLKVWAAANGAKSRSSRSLYTQHHDFGGFDQCGDGFSYLELHLTDCLSGNDGVDDLSADRKLDLREQAIDFDLNNAAYKLIAPAQTPHHVALWCF